MIRLSSAFWLLFVSAAALATFAAKYEVQALDDQLAEARKATATESRELRVLDAEWAYLNRPDMLAAMNQRFLLLAPITRKQLQTATTEIPMRPAPASPPPAALDAGSGPGAAADTPPPGNLPLGNPPPVVPPSLDRPAAPEKLAMASPPVGPLPIKPTAPPASPAPRLGSLDSRSLDQLIARIAAAR
jgi:hypothetical protein